MNKELETKDVLELLQEHNNFFESQKTKDINFRVLQLNKLKNAIYEHEKEISEALKIDLGKHEFESYTTEIGLAYSSIENAIKNIKKWTRPKKKRTPIYLMPSKSYLMSEPYGTVLIIGPYNYPFQLVIEPLIGAITAGNCAVIKPSEISPNVSRVITKIITKTFEKSYVRSVEGGVITNTSLINAPFDYIFFTGSVNVGKIVMEAAAKNLVPVTLELGGKSPVIVDETADIKIAAERIIWGKTLNAGQTCVAPDYLLVNKKVKEKLIEEMKNTVNKFFGHDVKASEYFGRIINERHFNRIKGILDKDKEHIIFGGGTSKEDRFIEPTLIEVNSFSMACMQEELFGPVLPVIEYDTIDDAISKVRNFPKPLALYLFTKNKSIEEKVLKNLSSGGVSINDTITHLANDKLPFGGVGNAGMGAYHGEESFKTFSHFRSVLKKGTFINLTMLYPPYSIKNLNLVKKFLK